MNSKNLSLIFIAVVTTIVLSSLFINILFLVTLVIPIILTWKFRVNFKIVCVVILVSCGFCIYVVSLHKIEFLGYIPNPLIGKINSFIELKYDEKTSALMEIILLNEKCNESSWTIYYQIKDMSLLYLISIGGLQFSIISLGLRKVIKSKTISLTISIIFFTFYSYLLGFPSALLRVTISTILCCFSFKIIKNIYCSLTLSLLISLLVMPSQITNIGFYLTYGCTFIVIYIYKETDIKPFLKYLLINILCTLFSIPFIASFDKGINLLFLLTSYPYGILIITLFFWYFFTWPLIFIGKFQNEISNVIFHINSYLSAFKLMIYI